MNKPHDKPALKLSDILFEGAKGGWTVNFEMHSRCLELEAELVALRAELAEARAALDWAAEKLTELSDNAGRWTRDEIMCESGHCHPEAKGCEYCWSIGTE